MSNSKAAIDSSPVLVINTGSSSLKLGFYTENGNGERLLLEALADGVGRTQGTLQVRDGTGSTLRSEDATIPSQQFALETLLQWLKGMGLERPSAIGHRVVHGGPHLTAHQLITPAVLDQLQAHIHFAPLHIPQALALIQEAGRAWPGVPQFACFDTAFHCTLPEVASRLPLPRALFDEGVRRYGFHGLSYESILYELAAQVSPRTVIAHLGSGASLAAILEGRSVDTSMGLTPTGGIPMGTRTGDLDPGVVLYLLRSKQLHADDLEQLLNHEAGLRALSGGDPDMRRLISASANGDDDASLAIEIFSIAIAKTVAAYAVVLGGLEMLIFTGGIGEHSAGIRQSVCDRLSVLGITLDASLNSASARTISTTQSAVQVCVIPTEEDLQIARHTRSLLTKRAQ